MLSADDRPKSSHFRKQIQNWKFHCHSWIQDEKMHSNEYKQQSIGAVRMIPKIAL